MDLNFCKKYIGDGNPPTNRYCRDCPESNIACDNLWKLVINLANSNGGEAVSLLGTNAVLLPNFNNPNIVYPNRYTPQLCCGWDKPWSMQPQ